MMKFTWAHGVVIALGLFIAFILYLIFIFPIGKQNSELVTESYYEDELVYQNVIDAKKNADVLPIKPNYSQTSDEIKVAFSPEIVLPNQTVKFHLYRTDDKRLDVEKELSLDTKYSFSIPKNVLIKGSYTLKVYWRMNQKDYQVDYDVEWK